MRLLNDGSRGVYALGLMLLLAGCGVLGSGDRPGVASAKVGAATDAPKTGPAADYPMVLGDAFTVDGIEYVPADTMNYDEVGYATFDAEGGVTASHKTLPLPSYVEVTSLETGKTILVRVERRGPMTGNRLIALTAGAQAQLGASEGTPVRVRRVNPPEQDRVALRNGQFAPERMETPMSLVEVLKRKLPVVGSASLNRSVEDAPAMAAAEKAKEDAPPQTAPSIEAQPVVETPKLAESGRPQLAVPVPPSSADKGTEGAHKRADKAVTDGFVIQAAAFSVEGNANRAAKSLDGFVEKSGKFFRVRTGPYATRGQADAALAKVKAAGYKDAKVFDAG